MKTIAESLSEVIHDLKWSDLPLEVIQKAKTCVLNGIGIGIANFNLSPAQAARELILQQEPGSQAALIGEKNRSTLMGAAFANGVLYHARGQEDTHGTSHLGTTVIPTALAMSEFTRASGKDFLLSVIIGYEVGAALGRKLTIHTTARGFRASSIYGILDATAATARLLDYTVDQITDAISFAATFAGGTTETFYGGGIEWNFENGMAVRNAVMAAFLAGAGMHGVSTSLDGPAGFCQAFAGTRKNLEKIVSGWGKQFEIMNVTFKPFTFCAFNHNPSNGHATLDAEKQVSGR